MARPVSSVVQTRHFSLGHVGVVVTSVVLGVGFFRGLPVLIVARAGGVPALWVAGGSGLLLGVISAIAIGTKADGHARRILLGGALTVAAASVGVQFSSPGSDVDFGVTALGAGAFIISLAMFVMTMPSAFTPGLFGGLALDAVVRASSASSDLSRINQPWMVVVGAVFALAHIALLLRMGDLRHAERARRAALSLFAVGPLLLVELQWLINQGWIAAAAQVTDERAAGTVVLGAAAAVLSSSLPRSPLRREPVLAAAFLLAFLLGVVRLTGSLSLVAVVLVAQIAAGRFLRALVAPTTAGRSRVTPFAFTAGVAAAAVAVAAYYGASASTAAPRPMHVLGVIGAVFVGAAFVRSTVDAPRSHYAPTSHIAGAVLVLAAGLLAGGVVSAGPDTDPERVSPGYPLRIATYNMHNGFSLQPDLNLASVASTIEQADVEVVALQEVSRGRFIDGGIDTLSWLQDRLGMRYVAFGPTSEDGTTGNAVLSRYEICDVRRLALPSNATPRGALLVTLRIGDGDGLRLAATHLEARDSETRSRQIKMLLEAVDPGATTVVLGDLNATADSRVVQVLERAGLEPVSAGNTYPSPEPSRTLDWIAHSSDLTAIGEDVVNTEASDHLPVVATLRHVPAAT